MDHQKRQHQDNPPASGRPGDDDISLAKWGWAQTFDAVPDPIAIVDRQHRLRHVNSAMADHLGLPAEKCLGAACYQLVHGTDVPPDFCPHVRTLSDGCQHKAEYRSARLDGDFLETTSPLKDADGAIVGSIHICQNVTEQKRAGRKAAYLASFPEKSPHIVMEVGLDGSLRYLNPAGRQELVGLDTIATPHPWLQDWANLLQTFRDQQVESLVREVTIGNRTYQQTICYWADDDAVRIYGLDITERKRAEESLRREHRTLRHLLQSSDHERQLIAYEIHDELAQQLAGAIMQLQTFAHLRDIDPDAASESFDAGIDLLRKGHFEARRLIAGVRPPILDESGVVAAIRHLIDEQNRTPGPQIRLTSTVDFDRLPAIMENTVYRIVQEALNNACLHSGSEVVEVRLLQRDNRIRIEVEDWGVGFDAKSERKHHFGLESLRQRARLLGGKCKIHSEPGQGTTVAVELMVVRPYCFSENHTPKVE